MLGLFYVAAAVAIAATLLALTRRSVVHGLLYLVVSLLAVALVFFALGAPFVAALEAIVYAGAIIVLFVFVVMMLGLGLHRAPKHEGAAWVGPVVLGGVLVAELVGLLLRPSDLPAALAVVGAKSVGAVLYGPYLVGVELASMLLLAALVGAHHLGRRRRPDETNHEEENNGRHSDATRPALGSDTLRPGAGRTAHPAQPALRPHGP